MLATILCIAFIFEVFPLAYEHFVLPKPLPAAHAVTNTALPLIETFSGEMIKESPRLWHAMLFTGLLLVGLLLFCYKAPGLVMGYLRSRKENGSLRQPTVPEEQGPGSAQSTIEQRNFGDFRMDPSRTHPCQQLPEEKPRYVMTAEDWKNKHMVAHRQVLESQRRSHRPTGVFGQQRRSPYVEAQLELSRRLERKHEEEERNYRIQQDNALRIAFNRNSYVQASLGGALPQTVFEQHQMQVPNPLIVQPYQPAVNVFTAPSVPTALALDQALPTFTPPPPFPSQAIQGSTYPPKNVPTIDYLPPGGSANTNGVASPKQLTDLPNMDVFHQDPDGTNNGAAGSTSSAITSPPITPTLETPTLDASSVSKKRGLDATDFASTPSDSATNSTTTKRQQTTPPSSLSSAALVSRHNLLQRPAHRSTGGAGGRKQRAKVFQRTGESSTAATATTTEPAPQAPTTQLPVAPAPAAQKPQMRSMLGFAPSRQEALGDSLSKSAAPAAGLTMLPAPSASGSIESSAGLALSKAQTDEEMRSKYRQRY